MSTKNRILDTALELFNAKGVHSVGVREIARALAISPGNLQYHFRRKEDLVEALIERMHLENTARMHLLPGQVLSFTTLADLMTRVMRNHLEHRGLIVAYPELVAASPRLQAFEASLGEARSRRAERGLEEMISAGLLDAEAVRPHAARLLGLGTIVTRFWLANATMEGEVADVDAVLATHVRLALSVWIPYATDEARAELLSLLG